MATLARRSEVRPSQDRNGYRFPPGFQRNLLWFALRKFRPANPIILFQHLAETYGDIAHYKIGPHHIVFLNHPEYIREVLVGQNDNFIKERTGRRTKRLLGKGRSPGEGPPPPPSAWRHPRHSTGNASGNTQPPSWKRLGAPAIRGMPGR